jgi:hypothetical protein
MSLSPIRISGRRVRFLYHIAVVCLACPSRAEAARVKLTTRGVVQLQTSIVAAPMLPSSENTDIQHRMSFSSAIATDRCRMLAVKPLVLNFSYCGGK